jgi:hypothetical protein
MATKDEIMELERSKSILESYSLDAEAGTVSVRKRGIRMTEFTFKEEMMKKAGFQICGIVFAT